MKFINSTLTKHKIEHFMNKFLDEYNNLSTVKLLDSLKLLGFKFSTLGGLSLSLNDLVLFDLPKIAMENISVNNIDSVQSFWTLVNNYFKKYILAFCKIYNPNNMFYIMATSGARGSSDQVHQILGMRGLMMDLSNNIIPIPIKHSFSNGLSLIEYIISAFGARKGVVDTALRTADSGYLTRRLVESSYNLILSCLNCFNSNVLIKFIHLIYDKSICSLLLCRSNTSFCIKCLNKFKLNLFNLGDPIGIISSQSLSEPTTQMVMRTFHTGGISTNNLNANLKNFKKILRVFYNTKYEFLHLLKETNLISVSQYKTLIYFSDNLNQNISSALFFLYFLTKLQIKYIKINLSKTFRPCCYYTSRKVYFLIPLIDFLVILYEC